MPAWPITIADVLAARRRIRPYLAATPLRNYPALDERVGEGIRVLVKHENHNPTNAFKARNGLAALTALSPEERARGVVAATRGNHGQGVAWAATLLGARSVVCVPRGNNPEKNEAMRAFGAELVEEGDDYDDAVAVADRLVADEGMTLVHSTNNREVIAGAGTFSLEILEEEPALDALVLSVGGGSQTVGALTVARALRPEVEVWGVQAEAASTIHDSWHAGERTPSEIAPTIADGLATRDIYEMTFETLRAGLRGFVTVSEEEIADALRTLLATTHNLVEGAGAAGLAGLIKLRGQLAGKRVGIVITGANIDRQTLAAVLAP